MERIGGGKNRAWVKDSSEKFEGRTETETCAARDAYVHKFLNTAPRAAPCKREHAGSSSAADAVQHSREARPRRGAAPTVSFVEPQIHGGRLPSQGGAAGPGRGHIKQEEPLMDACEVCHQVPAVPCERCLLVVCSACGYEGNHDNEVVRLRLRLNLGRQPRRGHRQATLSGIVRFVTTS